MTESTENKKRVCYHPRCPCGPQVRKKCDAIRAATCVWRMSKETAEFVLELWEQRDKRREGYKARRCCPACREQIVLVRYQGRWMELCTNCASLWYKREPYDWRGDSDGKDI